MTIPPKKKRRPAPRTAFGALADACREAAEAGPDTPPPPLEDACAGLGPDELRVLVMVAQRLAKGREAYGKLRIDSDSRTWRAELREELLDAIVYREIATLAGERLATTDALTATQERCNELLEEVRALRAGRAP